MIEKSPSRAGVVRAMARAFHCRSGVTQRRWDRIEFRSNRDEGGNSMPALV
jgi:hypothetical protein